MRLGFLAEGNWWQAAVVVLACHTNPPHGAAHPLEVQVDGGPIPQDGKHTLRLVCTNGACDRLGGREWVYRVQPELTGACAIAFHAIHEGHSFELYWDGVRLHPPPDKVQPVL